jgi:hypothetical protein
MKVYKLSQSEIKHISGEKSSKHQNEELGRLTCGHKEVQ